MLEMPIRTGRRLHGAVRQLREEMTRKTNERQQVNSLHRNRMTCADSLRPFSRSQDWTEGMSISPSGRFQVIEEPKARQKLISRSGIRWDAAWIALIGAAILCAAILLADLAGIGLNARTNSRLNSKIEDLTRRNDLLKQELALNAGDVSVCTEAVKLNLISGYGAQTIVLTAPQELSAGAVTADIRGAVTEWTSGNAE